MTDAEATYAFLAGLLLAAATGFRVFLPLCALSWMIRFDVIAVSDSFEWLANDAALIALSTAVVLEFIGDKFPAVDSALDSLGTILKPIAGAIVLTASLSEWNPVYATIIGIAAGGAAAEGIHLLKSSGRVVANMATLGIAAPVISLFEDVFTIFLIVAAVLFPLIALAILAVIIVAIVRRRTRRVVALIFLCSTLSADALTVNWIVAGDVDESFGSDEVRASALEWLQRMLPGERILSSAPVRTKGDITTASDWTVVYVPNHETRSMGRMYTLANGRKMILMNAERLSIGKISRDREERLLRHEFAHAMGLVSGEDHLMLVDGRHCTDPRCLLFGRVRAIDILAGLFPTAFAHRQPDELCELCRRDLTALYPR